ncbi:MNIO family bufferin maturase (plasmid) [Sphingomonas bisphenolicum]
MTATPIAPFAGFGLGLRTPHYQDFLTSAVPVDFVEVISENFMVDGGRPRHILDQIRERHPVALHGVSMSIGSADGLDRAYLVRLKTLVDHLDPLFVSDHLCWTRIEGFNAHDLLPLPYTDEALDLVCTNILQAQDMLERPMLIENPSTYLQFTADSMTEWQFLDAMCARTGCGLLLDVNNIYVSAVNHGFDPMAYLAGVPADRVRQIHLAGHSEGRDRLIDTHDQPVPPPVWSLYAEACRRTGPVATMIERDDDIPPLADLLTELDMARAIAPVDRRQAA